MAKYSMSQLMDLWKQAGGSAVAAAFAAAIAMAESGGDSGSVNHNSNGTVDRGLWQINSIHGSQSTTDPAANARAAVSISSNGTNWRPWCVAWSNGACGGTFLGTGSPVLKYASADGVQSVSQSQTQAQAVSNPLDWPGQLANAFLQPTFKAVWYGSIGFLGFLMAVGGVVVLVYQSRTAEVVRRLGGKVARKTPQGAVVEAAVEDEGDEGDEGDSGRHAEGGGRHRAEA